MIKVILTIKELNSDRLLHVYSQKCFPAYICRLNPPIFCMYCSHLLHA
jgi:hypothetical protein